MFSRGRNGRDNRAPPTPTQLPTSPGIASGVSRISQISPPRAIGDPPLFPLITLEEAQRRQSSHVRQHLSTPDLRGYRGVSEGDIPPVPRLTWNNFPLSPSSRGADRPSLRSGSEATSSFVNRPGLEVSVQSTPTKGDRHRGRSAARAVASIAEGLRQMNPFRRGGSRPNHLDGLASCDDLHMPSAIRRSGRGGILRAAETTFLPSSSDLELVVMTNPPSVPYSSTTTRSTPLRENCRFGTREQPRPTPHLNPSAADYSSPMSSQNDHLSMLQPSSSQGRLAHMTDPPSIPYGSTASGGAPVAAKHPAKDNEIELHQTAFRLALQTDVSFNPPQPNQHMPLPAPNDIMQRPLSAHPPYPPVDYPLVSSIGSGDDRIGRNTVQARHGATVSSPRESTLTAATFPSRTAGEIKTRMSPMRRDREGLGTSYSWTPLESSCGDDTLPLSREHYSIPMKGTSDVQKTGDDGLGKDLLQLKYPASSARQQDVTNDWKIDDHRSKHDITQASDTGFVTNPLTPATSNRESGDPRSPTSKQLLIARKAETQTTSTRRNRGIGQRLVSTAPNYFPPSTRKPLPSIPESQNADPLTPQRANVPARGVSTTPSLSGSAGLISPNFSRPRPLGSRLGSVEPPNFNPSPYGTLPRPSRTTAEAASSSNDPFMGNICSEDEAFEGTVVINTKPDPMLFTETKNSRGPSFERVIAMTEKLRRGQYDNGGTKLERVKKLIVKGLWNGVGFSNNDAENGVEQASEAQRREEGQAVELIAAVLKMMDRLQEFEWKSELPFTKALWPAMSTVTITNVFIDVFKAGVGEDDENGAFPPEDLVPLRTLTALRSLTLVGMTESYQKQIWEALWLIPSVRHLDLRMAIEPALRRGRDENWEYIKGSWKIRKLDEVILTYHGDRGSGKVHFNSGYGEYLDIMCMLKAWRVTHPDQPQRKMGLESLTLEGFIVDAQPFVKIFDEAKFKKLEFVGLNMDAGLALRPTMMIGMKMIVPEENKKPQVRQMATFYPAGSAKLITIGGKKKPNKK